MNIWQQKKMSKEIVFTLSQVAQHKSKQDCWIVINGKVLDATTFLEEHPGGEEVLIELAGKDATKAFEDIGHSKAAKDLLLKYRIGYLEGYRNNMLEAESNDTSCKEITKGKEMKAFVIKEEPVPRSAVAVELFVSLLAVAFYLCYRYMTGAI